MSGLDNLLEFKPKGPIPTHFDLHRQDYLGCQHKRTVVDNALRTIQCKDCKVQLDPIEVLLEIAYEVRSIEGLKETLEFKRFQKMESYVRSNSQRILMSDVELKMNPLELKAVHVANGCPKARMWFDHKMVRCYCGTSWNIDFYPALAQDVRAAHATLKSQNSEQA